MTPLDSPPLAPAPQAAPQVAPTRILPIPEDEAPAQVLAPQELATEPVREMSEDEQAQEFARQDAEAWAEGENRSTRVGRAVFATVAGGYLLWAQNTAPTMPRYDWGGWIKLSVVANFLIPLLIANLFFAQGLLRHSARDYWLWMRHKQRLISFHDYLPDQSLVAWHLGWKWRPLKRLAGLGIAMAFLMLPILWLSSRDPTARAFYQSYLPPIYDASGWAWLVGTLIVYMACWEWFFRGFLLFTLAQGFGAGLAIAIQAAMFGLAHAGKPPLEMASSFAGGLILGIVCWREKSFVPAFVAHALIHIAWVVLVLRF